MNLTREQEKHLFWKLFVLLAAVVIVVGLAVGLSVGLTCNKDGNNKEEEIYLTSIQDMMIVGGTFITVNDNMDVLTNTALYIDTLGRIADIGATKDMLEAYPDVDFTLQLDDGDIVMPGFINTHNHVCMTALGDVANDLEVWEWLTSVIFPLEGRLVTKEFCDTAFTLGMAEMLQTGTTTFVDVYFFEDDMAKLVEQTGMRAVLCESVINFPQPDFATPDETLAYAEDFLQNWQNHDLVTPCVFPHAPYTTDPWIYQNARALVDQYGGVLGTHLAESPAENDTIQETYGQSPTEYVNANGLLTPKTILAHSIWLSDSDIALIAEAGSHVSHLPNSDTKLASGILRLEALQSGGVNIAIGTDGPASNNDLDMIEEVKFASLLHKGVNLSPTLLPAEEAVYAATMAGARAIGKQDEIGSMEVGKMADLIIIKRDSSWSLLPAYDPYSAVVYSANGNNVFATIVAGKVLYYDGTLTTINEEALRRGVSEIETTVKEALAE